MTANKSKLSSWSVSEVGGVGGRYKYGRTKVLAIAAEEVNQTLRRRYPEADIDREGPTCEVYPILLRIV